LFGKKKDSLALWQERLRKSEAVASPERTMMSRRSALYDGTREIQSVTGAKDKKKKEASVVTNIVAEIVEAQVDSNIPKPKVTAKRQEDEEKAKIIEEYLRNEMDRLPFEVLNDMDERITPIQGGNLFFVEWDSNRHTHYTLGELCISTLHPKQVVFQGGVNDIAEMDYFIVRMSRTKEYIKNKFGIDVSNEDEEAPESRGFGSNKSDELVTENIAYYRNKKGGVGRYVWVNDTELEDIADYQARRQKKCKKCGQNITDEKCDYCGSTSFAYESEEYFTIDEDIVKSNGEVIPANSMEEEEIDPYQGMDMGVDSLTGLPFDGRTEEREVSVSNQYPHYNPEIFPLVVRKNVSAYGKVLGDSDVDKIADLQEVMKKCNTRIQEKLDKGGSLLTVGKGIAFEATDEQLKILRVDGPKDLNTISVKNIQVDTGQDRLHAEDAYNAARNIIGITDSFQGRKDATATSGKAKEFAAAQSAGRLESKRVMKNAMYATLFEVMFKFLLAYSDESRPVARKNSRGETEYLSFHKFDFLEQDLSGEWYWNDDFLFSVDTSAPLASNREAMWQETRMNLQQGAFGNPQDKRTLIHFWTNMDLLHYPGAADNKTFLEEQLQQEQQQMQEQMAQNMQMQQLGGMGEMDLPQGVELPFSDMPTEGGGMDEM